MNNLLKRYLYSIITDKRNDIFTFILKGILFLLSGIYYVLIKLTLFLYQHQIINTYRLPSKVISVGNITLGGTGKTPIEAFLIEKLTANSKISFVCRSYNKDEMNLLQLRYPKLKVLAGKSKVDLAKKAVRLFDPDIILVDDGYQHWKLDRDLDIVAIDAHSAFGNGYLLPRGTLREPINHLRRADVFFITKVDLADRIDLLKQRLKAINPHAAVIESIHKATALYDVKNSQNMEIYNLKNKKVVSFCGIGSPYSFRSTLENLEVDLVDFITYLDHHEYKKEDISKIKQIARQKQAEAVITTEKDWMRLNSDLIKAISDEISFYILKIDIDILSGRQALNDTLSNILNN
jgi:tetraacyldisaccharide 4'-kinase